MKKWVSAIILSLAFLIGLSLVLYPSFSDYWNKLHQSKAINEYAAEVAGLAAGEYVRMWDEAEEYQADTNHRTNIFLQTEKQRSLYPGILSVSDDGPMGYIEIPSIDCTLPIFHSTSEAVLQQGVGHIEWTSLPIGGEGTHCVLSGHRGLPSAKLFTDLSEVVVGDIFIIRVMNKTLTYEVDQILTVDPEDTTALMPVSGKDYCTLVTCTPYGINTHRLLVRGHRVENLETSKVVRITADAMLIEPIIVAPIVAVPLLLIFVIWLTSADRIRNSRKRWKT